MDYKEFFSFTKQERTGIIVFFILCSIMVGVFELIINYNQVVPEDVSKYYLPEDSIALLEKEERNEYNYLNDLFDDSYSKPEFKKQRFPFDPNTISFDSVLLLGFSKFGAKNLVNFRSKGGRIKDLQKLKSIYGMDTTLINDLSDLISFQSGQSKVFDKYDHVNPMVPFPEKMQEIVDLNRADSIQLESIKGLGPYSVKKILQYRKRLGGFLQKAQLRELNIIKDSSYQQVEKFLTADPSLVQKININTADYKTFITHPYFNAETINAIIKYRKQHGDFTDVKHISRIRSLKEETGLKILPYLTISSGQ